MSSKRSRCGCWYGHAQSLHFISCRQRLLFFAPDAIFFFGFLFFHFALDTFVDPVFGLADMMGLTGHAVSSWYDGGGASLGTEVFMDDRCPRLVRVPALL